MDQSLIMHPGHCLLDPQEGLKDNVSGWMSTDYELYTNKNGNAGIRVSKSAEQWTDIA